MVGFRRPSFSAGLVVVFIALVLRQVACEKHCPPSSCGDIPIKHPFRLKDDPGHCEDTRYYLSCENNRTILYLHSGKYLVYSINYDHNHTIRVVDDTILNWLDGCSFIPNYSLTFNNFTVTDPYGTGQTKNKLRFLYGNDFQKLSRQIIFFNCANPVTKSSSFDVNTTTCMNVTYSNSSLSLSGGYSYAKIGSLKASELEISCRINMMAMTSWPVKDDKINISYEDIRDMLLYGFELSWLRSCYFEDKFNNPYCAPICNTFPKLPFASCGIVTLNNYLYLTGSVSILVVIGAIVYCTAIKFVFGTPFVIAFLVYKWRRRHLSGYDNIEEYLHSQNNLNPIRYSYADIKKMTQSFQQKLGEGGFGSVYKGKLRSGSLVAVKLLSSKSKANGQDFINEVATIGSIHHVNVVQLIGFCVERSKRALVYDFMPNGSLDKHIFSPEDRAALSYEKMFEISLAIARGIEYLHRGCEKQILHFDIKPHNILLDENFTPKVSDFGLARLFSADESIVNLTAPRGTLGYMAPELCYKNFGGVSHKADVYSFGMLLMEMAGKRKNVSNFAEHSSQVFFPLWAYDQFNRGKDIEIEDATEEEIGLTKKMMIVALWCMQMRPSNRPPMNRVVKMLEGELESLQMPPYKPLEFPKEMQSVEDVQKNTATSSSSIPSDDWSSESVSLIFNSNLGT